MDGGAITADSMRPFVGLAFRVVAVVDRELDLRLAAIEERAGEAMSSLSLSFDGPFEAQLTQGTWELSFGDDDSIALFLVPVGGNPHDGLRYEATLTRLNG